MMAHEHTVVECNDRIEVFGNLLGGITIASYGYEDNTVLIPEHGIDNVISALKFYRKQLKKSKRK
jgi:hypothetical protein